MTADNRDARFRQAVERHAARDLTGAIAAYRKILAGTPDDVDVLYHLGVAEHQLHHVAEARVALARTIALAPDFPEAWQSFGSVLLDAGDRESAAAAFARAVELKPALRGARIRLASLLAGAGRHSDAVSYTLAGLWLAPADTELWQTLAVCIENLAAHAGGEAVRTRLGDNFPACADRAVLAGVALRWPSVQMALMYHVLLPELRASANALADSLTTLARPAYRDAEVMCVDLDIILVSLRRRVLEHWVAAPGKFAALPLSGLAALAVCLFQHEYAAWTDDDEAVAVAALGEALGASLSKAVVDPRELVLFACYRPLTALSSATALPSIGLPEALQPLLRQQVAEPLEEARIAPTIAAMTAIRHATSLAVGAMYEENPYPRWRSLPAVEVTAGSFGSLLEAGLPGVVAPAALCQQAFRVLIAGCGTGFQALYLAAQLPVANILAVDLSRASLAYAQRKANELGCHSVHFAQADILELGALDERFPYIECIGVLHHLADPAAGLRVLAGLLVPGGIVKLALYSERAREHHGILDAQRRVRSGGWPATADGIRQFRRELFSEQGDTSVARLLALRDVFSLSECRDLLFHEMEHRFTPPGLGVLCVGAGLRFAGFMEPGANAFARYSAQFPDDPRRLDLAHWDTFEDQEPGLFLHMYTFCAQKPL